jgi:hypothetical protein
MRRAGFKEVVFRADGNSYRDDGCDFGELRRADAVDGSSASASPRRIRPT